MPLILIKGLKFKINFTGKIIGREKGGSYVF
jgi:hypothetical protein